MINENTQTEECMEDFEAYFEESLQQYYPGAEIKGTIVEIKGDTALINFGYKTEGVANISEFENPNVGDEVVLSIVKMNNDGVILSKKAIDARSDWSAIKEKLSNEEPVDVKIKEYVNTDKVKGYLGKVGEIDAFIPENHIDIYLKGKKPASFINKEMKAKILKASGGRKKSILVSPKQYLLEEVEKKKDEFFSKHSVGDKVTGVVKTIKNYGVFVSFDGVDGFLHKNEMSWGRVKDPNSLVSLEDKVEVVILEMDKQANKLSLGMKELQADPWEQVNKNYLIGDVVKGPVVTRKRAGYVVEIASGIDGFVPNEEIGWLKNTKLTLNIKDIVEGKVIGYDNDRKKIIMSVKDLKENPWVILKREQPEGSVVKGTIKNITNFGLFVDFGSFLDGLVHIGDVSWKDEPINLEEAYKVGDTVEAKILHIDENKERISLGIKQLEANPWNEITKLLPAGKVIDAKIIATDKQGLEVALPLDMTGIIAPADLDPAKTSVDAYNVGDTVTAVVIKADNKAKQIILSIKKYLQDSERKETKEYMKKMETGNDTSFGNILMDKFD